MCCFFRAFFIFPFHKRREDPSIPADQAARTGLGSPAAVDTGTSTQARRARRERRERRARIRGGTATEDDFDAEIDAQERELAAAIKKREEIDLELRTITAEKKNYDKKLEECEKKLAAKEPGVEIADLRNEKELLEASIKDVLEQKEDLREDRRPLVGRIKELGADITRLERQAGAWHAYPFSLVWQAGPLSPSSLFVCIFFPQRPSQHDSIVRTQHTHSQLSWPASLFARHRIFSAVFTEE